MNTLDAKVVCCCSRTDRIEKNDFMNARKELTVTKFHAQVAGMGV